MNIAILSLSFDIFGRVLIKTLPNNIMPPIKRRISRAATLNARSAFSDGGCARSDRDPVFSWRTVSESHNDQVARMVSTYARVRLCTPEGTFFAMLREFNPGPKESSLSLYIEDDPE